MQDFTMNLPSGECGCAHHLPSVTPSAELSDRRDQQAGPEDDSKAWLVADVFHIAPGTALRLLCFSIEILLKTSSEDPRCSQRLVVSCSAQTSGDNVSSGESTPLKSSELHCSPARYENLGHDLMQRSVLSKRFLSKRVPPITLKDYLLRLHQYCPMSTGVYLATSIYITRMVTTEKVIQVNGRNMHRLVLAGLRVAMKTLEDLNYPHSRVAKVGGVTECELLKLEVSFCFLADFELRVDAQMLFEQARLLQAGLDQAGNTSTKAVNDSLLQV
ncbi:putative cyclin-dependent protein kinase complex component [Aspergillus saccharolyticus JOP 1030-1]|uniref:Cyclin-domain-containing protein n=1 Tax=Aspergillus saccharolyticus JOP 1030-1 TaxID=1450539 RepID=A0A318Z3J0_9EURO|nr:cyclin-domain-containing protein [Aspergillus saccharolyticus JOP 1030-1]PYH41871.1 cyclin-domain-containing protein [Aspergillus saccharolyticus JOP 1030-1]